MSPDPILLAKPILEVENLCVDINVPSGVLHAVQNVSFSLAKGETLCIVGESGCGKSITALSLMNLLPKTARRSADTLMLDGRDLSSETAVFLQRHFQRKLEVLPTATAGRYRLAAGSHVGTVVAPGLEIRIRPKCGTRNLFFLLSYAYRLADIRRELVEHEQIDDVLVIGVKI